MTTNGAVPPPDGKDDLVGRATGAIESVVSLIRDHSLRPVLTVLRFVLVGLAAAILGLLVLVLAVVGVVRLLTADAFSGRVWASDLVVGGLISLAGAFLLLWSRRLGRQGRHA